MFLKTLVSAIKVCIVVIVCGFLLGWATAAYADTTPAANSVLDPPWLTHTAEPWEALNIFTLSTDVYMDVPEMDMWSDYWDWTC